MHITPDLAVFALLLLQTAAALPQLLVPAIQDDPSSRSPKCQEMVAAMSDCFKDTPYLLNDLEVDQSAMRKCVCAKESFTPGIVTLCTGDPKTYSDLCGDGDGRV
ncbi:uncharacterized protein H6S33_008740 [Morchella sextelata]|uniref:uncharacterized protein n=1 Tax=Morchella sextelata TaxID=1174677 RepID=UPI001D03EF2D|nr:uncharacterized protein H6S33_008740 [Morchella sextelata]KAH0602401.1 hypothetical protein H6S33_008740 [Morchella sextelata]